MIRMDTSVGQKKVKGSNIKFFMDDLLVCWLFLV